MPLDKLKVDPMQHKLDMVIKNPKPEEKEFVDKSEMIFSYMNMIAFNNKIDLKLN